MFLGVGATANSVYLARNTSAGLTISDLSLDGSGTETPVEAPGAISRISYDPRVANVRLVYYATDAGERAFHFDAEDRKTQAALEKALAGASVAIVSKAAAGTRMIAHARYPDKPDEYYLYDKPGKRLELIAVNQ